MAWQKYNANPGERRVGDCTVRAISAAVEKPWEIVYIGLCIMGFCLWDMPSSNEVWGRYIREHGFRRYTDPCQDEPCTVREFCEQHPKGKYLLFVGGHVVFSCDGCWFDTWDSGEEYVSYYWHKKED